MDPNPPAAPEAEKGPNTTFSASVSPKPDDRGDTAKKASKDSENAVAQDSQPRAGYLPGAKVPMGKKQFWTVLLG